LDAGGVEAAGVVGGGVEAGLEGEGVMLGDWKYVGVVSPGR
jgi:hypothetical protein